MRKWLSTAWTRATELIGEEVLLLSFVLLILGVIFLAFIF